MRTLNNGEVTLSKSLLAHEHYLAGDSEKSECGSSESSDRTIVDEKDKTNTIITHV